MSDLPPVLSVCERPGSAARSKYFGTADATAIREAVIALARTVLPQSEMIFGGHPAISPLIARDLNLAFERLVWTREEATLDESVKTMRDEMLDTRRPFRAGVFIGGMEGIEKEWRLFRDNHPSVPAYPIASTGGASLILFEGVAERMPRELAAALSRDWVYGALFPRLPALMEPAEG